MKKVVWEVQNLSLLPVQKYCRKCGSQKTFLCSRQFRVNARRKYLDIWLIYKCSDCSATWNATVYSHISPQTLKPELLDLFYKNDKTLAEHYAMDKRFLQENGVESELPDYVVLGECFSLNEAVELEIKNKYSLPLRISSVVRGKLHLSQKEYLQMITKGQIKSRSNQDLQKGRLKDGLTLVFNGEL